ncbi:MAG: efflux RND transporter periplasmic adaptor subunit [Gemmataceae bacterium]|nr:efflux RND transporter periplasmic adaptor subunit [Gemmataceae bacterium]
MIRILTWVVLAVAVAGGLGFWYYRTNGSPPPQYRTAPVERVPLMASIAATGTIQPEEVIDVGAQVAGRIERFGLDPRDRCLREGLAVAAVLPRPAVPAALALLALVPTQSINYMSPVNEGTILAQIDSSLFQTRVDRAHADLLRARADLLQAQAKYHQTEREWERAQGLLARKAIAPSDYDLAHSEYDTAQANVQVMRSAIAQAESALNEAKINLGYTTIRSPVKGVIISRRVNIGQTVVASLNAPSLFLIAKDLTKLQVWAQVNEADIGQIRPGQLVYFTVDSVPYERFVGHVAPDQPRLDASMTQNVVTYTAVINTDNSHHKLKPYQTASLNFVTGQRESTLVVPNAALRWRPQPQYVAPAHRAAFLKSQG